MSTAIDSLPITETIEPADQGALANVVKTAYEDETPVYPIGGGTSLDFGLPAKREGIGLSMTKLNRVIDYPARDMTITVEAGITMKELADTLAKERQFLPVDVPNPEKATLGGVIATNFNGPRRYGYGTLRDYVIGISAVDGRGSQFCGGGRVVKNVAGYDFCKLLTGSLGTLGVITQVTLKVRPMLNASAFITCLAPGSEGVDIVLNLLVRSETTPAAIDLLVGSEWDEDPAMVTEATEQDEPGKWHLAVAFEGSIAEVSWMTKQIAAEWRGRGMARRRTVSGPEAESFWQRLAEFPAKPSPLIIKASVLPSGTTKFVEAVREVDPDCNIQAHAGNGIVIVRFSEFPADGLSRSVAGRLQPIASSLQGNIVILSNPGGAEMTPHIAWGGIDAPFALMTAVKEQFDPKDVLNPGRFVYL